MKKFFKYLVIIFLVFIIVSLFFYFKFKPTNQPGWGLTFSYHEAEGLGFEWKTMYLDVLNDLRPKQIRLMTYWNDIEAQRGNYNFGIVSLQMDETEKQGIGVILVVGRKQPRWPECYEPDWFKDLDSGQKNQAVLNFVQKTVEHFKKYPNIIAWQVENEPEFSFGQSCPKIPIDLLKQEVETVKRLDSRPVVVTDSGEIGWWVPAARAGADEFGLTLYRVAYNKNYGGYYKYPLPPAFYRVKAGFLQTFSKAKNVLDVELQAEPWFNVGAFNLPLDVQRTLMNPKIFNQNIEYARKTGFRDHYLWGVEWWYWMAHKNNDWGMWNAAKEFFKPN